MYHFQYYHAETFLISSVGIIANILEKWANLVGIFLFFEDNISYGDEEDVQRPRRR